MRDVHWPITLGILVYVQGLSGAYASAATDGMAQSVDVCFQYGCARHAVVALDETLLAMLERRFFASTNAAEERAAIASSVAELERFVGERTGTDGDRGGTFPGAFRTGQMDCIDESTNTTRYLQLYTERGWLRWHQVAEPATRLPIPFGWWPHTSAVIEERTGGTAFAVDSWFEDNGRPPHIVELPRWRRGWKPEAHTP